MWTFNVFLYLWFVFNPPIYNAMKAAGAPCYSAVPWMEAPTDPPPPCFYDLEEK